MTKLEDILGLTIIGYRYGIAPECGRSYNTRENAWEPGVSMAQVGYCKEVGSFAADACTEEGKHYYIGEIAGTGGDDEICLTNVRELTENEYKKLLPTMVQASNMVVNYYADRKISLINAGWNIGKTIEQIEQYRKEYKK